MKKKPIIGGTLPPIDPPHTLVCVSLAEGGHAKIKFILGETYTIPANYRNFLFSGKWGRVVIGVHVNSCHSEELVGKILRYVRVNYFTSETEKSVNHDLKFIEEIKHE